MNKLYIAIFCLILFIASFLRLWHLGNIPISLNWDEVSLGYNSYSILNTGMDEYGEYFPLVLRSFGDYKPALYAYVLTPFIAIFDLTPFAVRLPSALFGIVGVAASYLLVIELFKLQSKFKKPEIAGLVVMFLLAISPWHIQFSRAAFEANIATTFFITGFWFFLLGLKRFWFLALSALFFGLTLHSYHSPKLFIPLFLLASILIFKKELFRFGKKLMVPLAILILFIIPFLYFLVSGQGQKIFGRASQTSVFSKTKSIDNAVYKIGEGYLKHASLTWLFFTGDNDRHHAPSTGMLYIWELPFLLLGLFVLLRNKSQLRSVLVSWMLLGPLPSAFTTEVPHAVRTLIMLPVFQIITALGILSVLSFASKSKAFAGVFIYLFIIMFEFILFFHLYFYQMNLEFSRFWQFGYSDVVSYALQNDSKYKKVVVSNKLEQPYIFFLFFLKYDPRLYLEEGGTKDGEYQAFGKYEFRNINWTREEHNGTVLNILSPMDERSDPIHTIRYFDGGDAFLLLE